MGYADSDVRHAASTTRTEDEGFRASFVRKRYSLFGRPEPMSTFDIVPPPQRQPPTQHSQTQRLEPTSTPSVQQTVGGVLYHDLAPATDKSTQHTTESKRRSFFGGRFKFGGSKKDAIPPPPLSAPSSRRDPSPPKSTLTAQAQYQRGASSTLDLSDRVQLSEDEYTSKAIVEEHNRLNNEVQINRNNVRQSISPPFNFQHVTHTHKKHLPALETVDEKNLTKEFWAASAYQMPRAELIGIQADSIENKLETMGLTRGATSSAPSAAIAHENPASSSREDITALPAPSKGLGRSASRSKRDELSALLGLRDRANSSSSDHGQARKNTYNALHGIKEDGMQPISPISSIQEDASSKRSIDTHQAPTERPARGEHKRTSTTTKQQKQNDDGLGGRRDIGSMLGMWEHSLGDPEETSAKPKKQVTETPKEEAKSKRQSKQAKPKMDIDDIDALLGMPRRKPKPFAPMAPPAPPRPRRSDEDLRQDTQPAATTPTSIQAPDRPRRDSKDVQYLREMGFGQLLYRENSNESRTGASMHREQSDDSRFSRLGQRQSATDLRSAATPMHRQTSSDGGNSMTMIRQGSSDSRHSQATASQPQYSPGTQHDSYQNRTYNSDPYAYSSPAMEAYKSRQPVLSVPRMNNVSPEGRSPLQTVSEISETYSPRRSPTDSALQPRSPDTSRSPFRTIRSPELTGPSMPDDGGWENEIDYLYSKEAEANHEFDWEVSMTPHRLSVRDTDKRSSYNIPQGSMPRLSKKLSEGSMRSSIYMPAALNVQPFAARQQYYPQEPDKIAGYHEDQTTAGARASPEVRVYDVDDQRQVHIQPVGSLHMHGYETVTHGYLSDPESTSEQSQHRKSNSYSSWESRPSNPREYARYSNASINNAPDFSNARQRKAPIVSIPQQHSQQPGTSAMHDYAAFSRNPYDSPQTPELPYRRPETIGQTAMLRATVNRARDQTSTWARPAVPAPPQSQQSGWI